MYNNPYVDPLRRRFQQPDVQAPVIQQPQPMMGQPAPAGPEMAMQWMPGVGGEQEGQQMDMGGIGALLKRFQKPGGGGVKGDMPMGGFEGKG